MVLTVREHVFDVRASFMQRGWAWGFLAGDEMWHGLSVSGWLAGEKKNMARDSEIDEAEPLGRVTTVQYSSLYGSEITTSNTPLRSGRPRSKIVNSDRRDYWRTSNVICDRGWGRPAGCGVLSRSYECGAEWPREMWFASNSIDIGHRE